ncbi:MAG: DUF2971 domain-containing protein [Solirubrobacterales bacterium]
MKFPTGRCLCHYTTREAAFGHILPMRELRMPSLRQMRDPLENQSWLIGTGGPAAAEVDSARRKDQEFAYFHFNLLANSIRERARLLALTTDAEGYSPDAIDFSRGWARPRMWENYGENHSGVCLIFDRDRLIENLTRALQAMDLPTPYHQKVRYTETGGSELTLDLDELVGKVDSDLVARFIEAHHEEMFFRKALDWATEYEYRFLVTVPEHHGALQIDYGDSLKAVVVGERFPGWERPAAHSACRQAGIEAMRLEWTLGRPALAELPAAGVTREDAERFQAALQASAKSGPTGSA